MARYGYGYEYGARPPRRGGMSRPPRGDFGRPPRGYGAGGRAWGDGYGEWGAPRYGGDFERPRGHPGGRGGHGGPGAGEGDADRVCVGEIMTCNPEVVTPGTPLVEVARRMRDLDVGILPVVDDEIGLALRGVVTDRDITVRAGAEGKDLEKTTASEVMTSEVRTVRETDHVRDLFAVMKRERVRRVPVVDEEGKLVGIVAQADLAIEYAGLDLRRESEVEEVIERISEPGAGRPRGYRPRPRMAGSRYGSGYDRDLGDRLRQGLHTLRREAQEFFGRDHPWGWHR